MRRFDQTLPSNLANPITVHHNLHEHFPNFSLFLAHSSSSILPLLSSDVGLSVSGSVGLSASTGEQGNSLLHGRNQGGGGRGNDTKSRKKTGQMAAATIERRRIRKGSGSEEEEKEERRTETRGEDEEEDGSDDKIVGDESSEDGGDNEDMIRSGGRGKQEQIGREGLISNGRKSETGRLPHSDQTCLASLSRHQWSITGRVILTFSRLVLRRTTAFFVVAIAISCYFQLLHCSLTRRNQILQWGRKLLMQTQTENV